MRRVAPAFLMSAIISFTVTSCLNATQVTFKITTDIPCDQIGNTAVTAGIEGETERAAPMAFATSCSQDGTVGAVGTYAVYPGMKKDVTASFKVTVAVAKDTDVKTSCTPAKGYRGCIVARRRINFVAHRGLTVPVALLLICKDVQCDENSTCNKLGRCVNNFVDTSDMACDSQGNCTGLITNPGDGLPCFNTPANPPSILCSGDLGWCVRDSSGMRSCAAEPGVNGVSYQCRNARDCGPFLKCVLAQGAVLGRCVVDLSAGDIELCTPDDVVASCSIGARLCITDAGYGLLSCGGDAGINMRTDGGTLDGGSAVDAGPSGSGTLYVADRIGQEIISYPLSWSATAITFETGTSFDAGLTRAVRNMVVSTDRKWVFAYDTSEVNVMSRNTTTGRLTGSATIYDPGLSPGQGRVVVAPNDRFIFVSADCGQTQNISMAHFDPAGPTVTDTLDPANPVPAYQRCTGSIGSPDGMTISADGRFLYAGGVTLESSAIDAVTGIAVPFGKMSASMAAGELALVRQGTVLLATDYGNSRVVASPIDGDGGLPGPLATTDAGARVSELAVHPNGNIAWSVSTLSAGSGTEVWTTEIAADATLTSTMSKDLGTPTADIAVFNDGSWVMVSLPMTNQIAYVRTNDLGQLETNWQFVTLPQSAVGALLFVPNP